MSGVLLWSKDRTVSGWLSAGDADPARPLLVCIHGGGCNRDYFDLKGCSMLAAARARGFAVLRVNRPGYAGTPIPTGTRPIATTPALIRRFVDAVRAEHAPATNGVALIGHSIGGAIALRLAGEEADWPLRAVAVSGIGDRVAPDMASVSVDRGATRVDAPQGLDALLFENGGRPLSWRALASLRRAAEPWLVSEVFEIVEDWPKQWPAVARAVHIPVQVRLAEYERLWQTGQPAVDRVRAALTNAPMVDAAQLPEGGHLYEVCRRGPELIEAQLDFIERFTPSA